MIEKYIQPSWPKINKVHAYTTTRCGGFSHAPYDEFNLGLHVNDNCESVAKNRNLLQQELGLAQSPFWLQQVHGIDVASATSSATLLPQADASYSHEPNQVCVILTADCVPILVCNKDGTEVAAIHAGWRGLLNGVIENTIQTLTSPPTSLQAWIGPAIGPDFFEINADIRAQFLAKNNQFQAGFFSPFPQRWFADLFILTQLTLEFCGIQDTYCEHLCTYRDKQRFYSHRRDQGVTGRMASLIWIKDGE